MKIRFGKDRREQSAWVKPSVALSVVGTSRPFHSRWKQLVRKVAPASSLRNVFQTLDVYLAELGSVMAGDALASLAHHLLILSLRRARIPAKFICTFAHFQQRQVTNRVLDGDKRC